MADRELDHNTRLAADRTRLAYERTLMAWVRTSTSLIAFGFTIYQVFDYLERQPGVRKAVVKPGVVGIVMIVIAISPTYNGGVGPARAKETRGQSCRQH